ncbi:MAG: response regulator [Candidatus Omnitrophota bacterium]
MAKILVVDDESKFRDIIKERLIKEGYEVETAIDGEEGLNKAKVITPDLIICDMKMPKMDGFELLKDLRKKENMATPFIMLTSIDDFDNIQTAYEHEANFYITKPVVYAKLFESTKLLDNIRVLLSFPTEKDSSQKKDI